MQKKVLKQLKELRLQYMKRYYIFVPLTVAAILLVVSGTAFLLGRSVKAAALTDNLVSFWKLSEASGTRNDSVSTNHLLETGLVGYDASGRIGGSASYTNSIAGNYLATASDPSLISTGNFSVSLWVNMYDASLNNQFFVSEGGKWAIFKSGTSIYFRQYIGLNVQESLAKVVTPVTGTWYHIVVTHDFDNKLNTLYVNNSATASTAYTTEIPNSGNNSLQLGQYNAFPVINAKIDAVGYWDRVLDATDVSNLYASGGGIEYDFTVVPPTVSTGAADSVTDTSAWLPGSIDALGGEDSSQRGIQYDSDGSYSSPTIIFKTGSFSTGVFGEIVTGLTCNTTYHFRAFALNSSAYGYGADTTFMTGACGGASSLTDGIISFWKMEEDSASRVDDVGSNDLAETGGSSTNESGIVNYGSDLNSEKYLTIDNNPSLQTGGTDFTVSVWVYLDSTANNQIFAGSRGLGSQAEWGLFLAGGRFYFSTYKLDPPDLLSYAAISTTVPVLHTWYHITGVHSATDNKNYIYVNASMQDDIASQETTSIGKFQVGAWGDGFKFIDARVDALGFWRRALIAGEVTELYRLGSGIEYPFTTSFSAPTVTTGVAGSIGLDSVVLNGNITSTGGANATIVGFDYGLTAGYGLDANTIGSYNNGFSLPISGLQCGQTYHFRAYAINEAGTGQGLDANFSTLACINSITVIDSPVQYQVFQRDGSNLGDIAINGHFTNENGASTIFEAAWNGQPYETLTTTITSANGGTFSGILSDMPVGQGVLTVRFQDYPLVNDTKNDIGIGDIFAIAGQSNAMGYGLNNQSYSSASFKAVMFGNDDVWKELADPVDIGVNQIDGISYDTNAASSIWPLLATLIMADQNVPVAFVPAANGSSYLEPYSTYTFWQRPVVWPPANYPDTLYGSMYRRIQAAGGVKAVLYWQGENEAKDNYSQAAYYNSLNTFANNIFSDFGVKVSVAQIGDFCTTFCPPLGLDNVRLAQQQAWNSSTNVVLGPSLYDVNISDEGSDGLHFKSNADMQIAANRWWAALKQAYYGGTSGRGPRIVLAEYNPAKTEITVTFQTNSQLLPAAGIDGFTVEDGGAPVAISSVDRIADNKIKITLGAAAAGVITVSYGQGRTANLNNIADVLTDSSAYNLPAEIFVDHATVITDTNAPTFIINDGVSVIQVLSDVINVTVTDAEGNLDASTVKYGFSSDAICNAGDTYGNSFTSGVDFTITGTNHDYLCVTASDWSVNIGYQLVGQLNIYTASSGGGSNYSTPPCQFSINNNDISTDNQIVNLKISGFNLQSQMLLSNFMDFENAAWEPFTTDKVWTLAGAGNSYGIKTVFAKMRNIYGAVSNVCSDSIEYVIPGSDLILEDPKPAEKLPEGIAVGDLVKIASSTTVYFIDEDNRRHPFPNESVFFSYFSSFVGIKEVLLSTISQIPIGHNVTVRPGTWLVKIQTVPKVYAVEPYGVLRWIPDEGVAVGLYGADWATRIVDVEPTFFTDYQLGSSVTANVHPTGTAFSYLGDNKVYYIDQGKKRYISTAAFFANKFQNQFILRNVPALITYEGGLDLPVMRIEEVINIR